MALIRKPYDANSLMKLIVKKTNLNDEINQLIRSINQLALRAIELEDPVLNEELRCMNLLEFDTSDEARQNLRQAREIDPYTYNYEI